MTSHHLPRSSSESMYASAVSQNVHPLAYTASNTYQHASVKSTSIVSI
jgi:hypothetical protein